MSTPTSDTFSVDEYRTDAGAVVAHAIRTGRAIVARADGSVRVAISIPPAEAKQ